MKRACHAGILIGATVWLLAGMLGAEDRGIFVNGGYSPGSKESSMDKFIKNRLAGAAGAFKKQNPGGVSTNVSSAKGLEDAIKAAKPCDCDDTITVVMMGHGTGSSFKFVKEGKSVTARDLKTWLESIAVSCCCKIHVIIFSCHSGGFLDYLFDLSKGTHVKSAHASSKKGEKTWGDGEWDGKEFKDKKGDWMHGFNQDWSNAVGATVTEELAEAARTAKEKMPPDIGRKQHPTGWQTGPVETRAHVEEIRKNHDGVRHAEVKVKFHDPHFLEGQTRIVRFNDDTNAPSGLKKCDWITVTLDFGEPKSRFVPAVSPVTPTNAPTEKTVSRVLGIDHGAGNVSVRMVEPNWMNATAWIIQAVPPGQVDPTLLIGDWIRQDVSVDDPTGAVTTTQFVTRVDEVMRAKGHVCGPPDPLTGTVPVELLEPDLLYGENATLQLFGPETNKLAGLGPCTNVWFEYHSLAMPGELHLAEDLAKVLMRNIETGFLMLDAGMDTVLEPALQTEYGVPVHPAVRVRNTGQGLVPSFPVTCTITCNGAPVFSDSRMAPDLFAGGIVDLDFEGWIPDQLRDYEVAFEIVLADDNVLNNSLLMTTSVVITDEDDTGWLLILSQTTPPPR